MKIKKILNEDRKIDSLMLYSDAMKQGYKNTISASQMEMFLTCPFKWYLANVKKLKYDDPGIHLLYGSAFHHLLFKWLRTFFEETTKAAESLDVDTLLLQYMKEEFKEASKKGNKSFTTPTELAQFHNYGATNLKYLIKKRGAYFSKRGWELIGLEYPIICNTINPNVGLIMMIDLVLYHIKNDMYYLKDIKTSNYGWKEDKKNSEITKNQLLLYKDSFSKKFNIDPDKVDIEYMIFKNIIPEESEFPIKRIQIVRPSSGKVSLSKFNKSIDNFITSCFNADGSKIDKLENYKKTDNIYNCKFCIYKTNKICNGAGSY